MKIRVSVTVIRVEKQSVESYIGNRFGVGLPKAYASYTIKAMKYPSVFFAILIAWIVVDVLAAVFDTTFISYRLYIFALTFSLALFLVGFWRNR
jgi:hypothetical protein